MPAISYQDAVKDRFARNTVFFSPSRVLGLLAWAFYQDPQIAGLNRLLDSDAEIAAYPYRFRVFDLENGTAVMGTPRSAEFPAFQALGILYPALAGLDQDAPELMEAQQETARIQEHARALVLTSDRIKRVRWELDRDWLTEHGIAPGTY